MKPKARWITVGIASCMAPVASPVAPRRLRKRRLMRLWWLLNQFGIWRPLPKNTDQRCRPRCNPSAVVILFAVES